MKLVRAMLSPQSCGLVKVDGCIGMTTGTRCVNIVGQVSTIAGRPWAARILGSVVAWTRVVRALEGSERNDKGTEARHVHLEEVALHPVLAEVHPAQAAPHLEYAAVGGGVGSGNAAGLGAEARHRHRVDLRAGDRGRWR